MLAPQAGGFNRPVHGCIGRDSASLAPSADLTRWLTPAAVRASSADHVLDSRARCATLSCNRSTPPSF